MALYLDEYPPDILERWLWDLGRALDNQKPHFYGDYIPKDLTSLKRCEQIMSLWACPIPILTVFYHPTEEEMELLMDTKAVALSTYMTGMQMGLLGPKKLSHPRRRRA